MKTPMPKAPPKAPTPPVRVTMAPPPPLPWMPTPERREGLVQDIYYTAVRLLLETHQIRTDTLDWGGAPIPSLADYPYFLCGTLELPIRAGQFRLGNDLLGEEVVIDVPAFTIILATGPLVREEIIRTINRRAARSAKGLDWVVVDPPVQPPAPPPVGRQRYRPMGTGKKKKETQS